MDERGLAVGQITINHESYWLKNKYYAKEVLSNIQYYTHYIKMQIKVFWTYCIKINLVLL